MKKFQSNNDINAHGYYHVNNNQLPNMLIIWYIPLNVSKKPVALHMPFPIFQPCCIDAAKSTGMP